MSAPALEFVRVTAPLGGALGDFLADLRAAGDEPFFHPHPLTREHATVIAADAGPDLYYAATLGGRVVGYAMLRGWAEGYEVPSLGIAMHPTARGTGIGRAFMHFLHAAARARGATRVRLKVYRANARARALYSSIGYEFTPLGDDELLGILPLSGAGAAS